MSNANEDTNWQPWKLSVEQQGGGRRQFLQSCSQQACHSTLKHLTSRSGQRSFVMGDETLDDNFKSKCSAVRRWQKFILSGLTAVKMGRHIRHGGCYLNNLLYSLVMRHTCSWHVVVIEKNRKSEKTPAKMQLLKILVGLLFPMSVLKKSKQKRLFFSENATKLVLQN